uniref:Metalloendopeptidase n=1 Tax=Parastrongyloides trichosuri TaxID=131310 RepID=A0A0N4Z845_PARTI
MDIYSMFIYIIVLFLTSSFSFQARKIKSTSKPFFPINSSHIYYKFNITERSIKNDIRKALYFIGNETCLTFEEVKSGVTVDVDYTKLTFSSFPSEYNLTFNVSAEINKHTTIYLSKNEKYFDILQLILEALGLIHPHQRPDRDDYVKVNHANIEGHDDFFTKRQIYDPRGTGYDFGSIMHIPLNKYAKNDSEVTLAPLSMEAIEHNFSYHHFSAYNNLINETKTFSFNDKKYLSLKFCPSNSSFQCQNGGYRTSLQPKTCVCPEGFIGNVCSAFNKFGDPPCPESSLLVTSESKNITIKRNCSFVFLGPGLTEKDNLTLCFKLNKNQSNVIKISDESNLDSKKKSEKLFKNGLFKIYKDPGSSGLSSINSSNKFCLRTQGPKAYIFFAGGGENQLKIFYATQQSSNQS